MIERIRHALLPLGEALGKFVGIDTIVAHTPEEIDAKWQEFASHSHKFLQIVSRDGHFFNSESLELIANLPQRSEIVVGPNVTDDVIDLIRGSKAKLYKMPVTPAQNFIIRDGDALLIEQQPSRKGERVLFEIHNGMSVVDIALTFYQLKHASAALA